MPAKQLVSSKTLISEILSRFPSARAVLDKAGLHGCGGIKGPRESIKYFAKMHDLDEIQLITKLNQAICKAPTVIPVCSQAQEMSTASIYQYFFKTAILFILSAGASWGVWLLFQIGINGTYTSSVSLSHINAHGHVMIFGWVILFVMGFAYQALPRMWRVKLYKPHLAFLAFTLMTTGIITRTLGMGFDLNGAQTILMVVGNIAEILAISIFIFQLYNTFDQSDQLLSPYIAFIGMGLFWMLAQAVYGSWHFYQLHVLTGQKLLNAVATYQAPLRDMQVHGMALCIILGVGMRVFVGMFGFKPLNIKIGWWSFIIINISVLLEIILFLVYRTTGNHLYAGLLMLPWLGLFGGCLMYTLGMNLTAKSEIQHGSVKYVRTAFSWLMLSMLMLLLLPVYQVISEIKFSHAYYGAIRHAITVGFISLLILGISTRMAAAMNQIDQQKQSWMWWSFILINLGCFLRVTLQIATDWHEIAFKLVGFSGALEVSGILIWAAVMWSWMKKSKTAEVQNKSIGARAN